jgi:hypothetical protein
MKLPILFKSVSGCLLAFALVDVSLAAGPAQNLPNYVGQKDVGRLRLFETPKAFAWYLPTGLSSELYCPTSGRCVVKVLNTVQPSEITMLEKYSLGDNRGAMKLNSFDPAVISVQESFANLRFPGGQEWKQESLNVHEKASYATYAVRVKPSEVGDLQNAFNDAGLGEFVSRVTLNAESVEDYLTIQNPNVLVDELSKLTGRTSGLRIDRVVDEIVEKLRLDSNKFSQPDARLLTRMYIKLNMFDRAYGFYKVRASALARQDNPLFVRALESGPFQIICETRLLLKADSTATTSCRGVDE